MERRQEVCMIYVLRVSNLNFCAFTFRNNHLIQLKSYFFQNYFSASENLTFVSNPKQKKKN
jgi:hypothetical protein